MEARVPRTLGRWDLVLLKIVAIVNINNVPPVAVYGRTPLVLWAIAFATFFVPEAIAVLVLAAAVVARASGAAAPAPAATPITWEMTTSFAVMCNALVGIELASTMGDEIRNPARDLGPAIAIAGVVSIASYLLVTGAVLALVPVDRLGVIQGVMQAVTAGAARAHIGWIVAPLAIVMGLATGGAASAWVARSSPVSFAGGPSRPPPAPPRPA